MNASTQKLHLGCFDQVLNGWTNTDITPHIFLARITGMAFLLFKIGVLSRQRYEQHKKGIFNEIKYLNVTKKFSYADSTFDYVFSSHLIEHLYPYQAIFCFNEIFRVLKRGGVVRIVVPDLDKILKNYNPKHPEIFLESIFETKQKHKKNKHHWHYNEISLTKLLKETGFSKIYRCKFRKGNCAHVALIDKREKSLFMEAIK